MSFERVLLIIFCLTCIYNYVDTLLRYFGVIQSIDDIPTWRLFTTPFFFVTGFIFLGMFLLAVIRPQYQQVLDPKSDEIIAFTKYRGFGYLVGCEDSLIKKYMGIDCDDWYSGEIVNKIEFKKSGKFNKVCRGLFVKA